jgi:hypothetical protein
MAPRGSRNNASSGRNSAPSTRGAAKGGIQKRRAGPNKTDNDGDLDMDSAARRNRPPAKAPTGPRKGPSTRSATNNPRGASKSAQIIAKHLKNGKGADMVKERGPLQYLRIYGMKQSSIASNSDVLDKLLSFLERKATRLASGSKRTVTIKKVCLSTALPARHCSAGIRMSTYL